MVPLGFRHPFDYRVSMQVNRNETKLYLEGSCASGRSRTCEQHQSIRDARIPTSAHHFVQNPLHVQLALKAPSMPPPHGHALRRREQEKLWLDCVRFQACKCKLKLTILERCF